MHPDHEVFLAGIEKRRRVVLVSRDDLGRRIVRVCAPMDFGMAADAWDELPRYFFWDFEDNGGKSRGAVSLLPSQIFSIAATEEPFEPAEFVPLDATWNHPRDWGEFS
jgi:hypothetical protein